jgi:hypothetical protein
MKNAVLTVTSDGNRVLVIVEGDDDTVTLTLTPADARDFAAKLLKEAYTIDVEDAFVRRVGEA